MKFLVLSHTHSLLPFAYRLQLQDHEVQPVVVVQAFEAAWRGKYETSPRAEKGMLDPEWVQELLEKAVSAETIVITDDWKLQEKFQEVSKGGRMFGLLRQAGPPTEGLTSPVRFGGWFDGECLNALHLLVVDRGAWPGGMGPVIDGALTVVRIDDPETLERAQTLTTTHREELKSKGFRGLVQFNVNFQTESGEPEVDGMLAGWPFLHSHAFISELEDLGGLLAGATIDPASPLLPRKFVTVLPISRPPWPTRKAKFRFDLAAIEGLTGEQMARIFWHDVQVQIEEEKLTTAGLDGLVGVVRGAADTSELARGRALEVALRIRLAEKQFRSDAGSRVQSVLGELEARFGVLI